jgi:hypothetical protein
LFQQKHMKWIDSGIFFVLEVGAKTEQFLPHPKSGKYEMLY